MSISALINGQLMLHDGLALRSVDQGSCFLAVNGMLIAWGFQDAQQVAVPRHPGVVSLEGGEDPGQQKQTVFFAQQKPRS